MAKRTSKKRAGRPPKEPSEVRKDVPRFSVTAEEKRIAEVAKTMCKNEGLKSIPRWVTELPIIALPVPTEDYRDYLKMHGEEWEPAPLPKGIRRGTPKQCFANATRLITKNRDLHYVEGIAYGFGDPSSAIHHAWAVTNDGKVIDNTWEHPAENRYYGIKYDLSQYAKLLNKPRSVFGVIANRYRASEIIANRHLGPLWLPDL